MYQILLYFFRKKNKFLVFDATDCGKLDQTEIYTLSSIKYYKDNYILRMIIKMFLSNLLLGLLLTFPKTKLSQMHKLPTNSVLKVLIQINRQSGKYASFLIMKLTQNYLRIVTAIYFPAEHRQNTDYTFLFKIHILIYFMLLHIKL